MIKADKKKVEDALQKAIKNEFWKKQYENAPTDECKEFLKFSFYNSEYYDPDAEDAKDFDEYQEEVESKLNAEDWEYLKKMLPNSPFVGYCDSKIKELTK